MPALAGSPTAARPGAAFVAAAGLAHYALGNAALAKVRGGFAAPGGVNFTFGFQQTTSINGIVVQSILVPVLSEVGKSIPVFVVGGQVAIGSAVGDAVSVQTGLAGQGTDPPPAAVSVATAAGAVRNGVSQQGPSALPQQTLAAMSGGEAAKEYSVPTSDPTVTVSTVARAPDGGVGTAIRTTLGANGVLSSVANGVSNRIVQQATTMTINVGGLAESVAAARAESSVLRAAAQGFNLP